MGVSPPGCFPGRTIDGARPGIVDGQRVRLAHKIARRDRLDRSTYRARPILVGVGRWFATACLGPGAPEGAAPGPPLPVTRARELPVPACD